MSMGFFNFIDEPSSPVDSKIARTTAFLHKMECKACPLNTLVGLCHPHMKPTGTDKPLVYMLGEAPGADEDKKGVQFVGASGRVLRWRIPDLWLDKIRWNNCVRTRPPENREPTPVEIEACRPSIIRDIEKSKPKAIFGFGNVPLRWITGMKGEDAYSGITNWAGRRLSVRVGSHDCFFYPMFHPSYVMRSRFFVPKHQGEYGSEIELAFAAHLRRAFEDVRRDSERPCVVDTSTVFDGVETDNTIKEIREFLSECEGVVGFDYETNGLRPYKNGAKILTVSVSTGERTIAFPIDHPKSRFSASQKAEIVKAWKDFLISKRTLKVAHNLSFELEWTGEIFGKEFIRSGRWGDTQCQAYILDERQGSGVLSLDALVFQHFGFRLKAISNLDVTRLEECNLTEVLRYNALDAKYTRMLYLAQRRRLKADGLVETYRHQLRRVPTCVLTQIKGLPVSQKVVSGFDRQFSEDAERLERAIEKTEAVERFRQVKGRPFNPASTQDVGILFRSILAVHVDSVDEESLSKVKHPIAKDILELRKINKIWSTYVKGLMPGGSYLHDDGRLHPVIKTMGTRTWRTSSEEPNEQNWPKHVYQEVRSQICPGRNHRFVSFDYGQIQARNIAMETKDANFVKSFWDRTDIHVEWRDKIVRKYPKWVDGGWKAFKDPEIADRYRYRAKNEFVFASFFGSTGKSSAARLGIPENIGYELAEEFWDKFPNVKKWHKSLESELKTKGYVSGLSGFRRRAPMTPNEMIAAPIQSDEALIVCNAMADCSNKGFQASLVIHDDLTFVWHKDEVDRKAEVVIDIMLNVPFEWAKIVPIAVDMSVGTDWSNCKKVGTFTSDQWKRKTQTPTGLAE